ncbi:MAG: ComF family protein [Magnetococcales bacterium]|nr:ComF family protein [Magnetococcales bacterium]
MNGGWWQRGWRYFLEALFPAECLLCRQKTEAVDQLCLPCMTTLPASPDCYCLRCGQRTAHVSQGCGHCLAEPEQHADATYFAFSYDDPIASWLIGLKFADRPEWARTLGWLLWQRLGNSLQWETPALVLPVPLHPLRLLRRRYNQSALLAATVARRLHVPLQTRALRRIKRTKPQTRLSAVERAVNLRDAFRVESALVAGKDLLLLDDVYTTGATMQSAVRALKQAGAGRVVVVCLAVVQRELTGAPAGSVDYSILTDSRSW